jgi:microcystin synthetase protein McyJ
MNLGLWSGADNYADACSALADLVAVTAELSSGEILLDVGSGFGQPARHWLTRYNPSQIIGLNLDLMQCQVARRRARTIGAAQQLPTLRASATAIPIAEGSMDKIIALESAFHFETRDVFFREAYRTLKPGGKLVIADMLPSEDWITTDHNRRTRWYSFKPEANIYPLSVYLRRLEAAGFNDVHGESIRHEVFPGAAKVVKRIRDQGASLAEVRVEITPDEVSECHGVELWQDDLGLGDFAIFRATRPTKT